MTKKIKLTAAIATYNEEGNIGDCLESVRELVDEIVVVDGTSQDKTVEIAKKYGARVLVTENYPIFHINKQKAFDFARGEWILYLDADERVSPGLAKEIKELLDMNYVETEAHQQKLKNKNLFLRHQKLLELRDGQIGDEKGEYTAYFFPRLNYFLGKYLKYGGVYPDGVIRLFKKGNAHLPCKSVHEQMVVKGRVGWLQNDLMHIDSPDFERYLLRNSRYINLIRDELKLQKTKGGLIQFLNYMVYKPVAWFFLTQIRHKGILDGFQGVVFSFFSALRFPRAYWRYITNA